MFLAGRKSLSEKGFTDVDDGFYICNLIDAQLNKAKSSGRKQVTFTWEIDEDDSSFSQYGKKLLYDHIGLERDGQDDPELYMILQIKLNQLNAQFDAESIVDMTEDQFTQYMNAVLESLVGSKVRLHKYEKNEFTNYRVKKLLETPQEKPKHQHETIPTTTNSRQNHAPTPQPQNEVTLQIGMDVIVDNRHAKIFDFTQDGKVIVLIGEDKHTVTLEQLELPSTTTSELIEELEEPPTLEVGMNVTALFNGQKISGEIHSFLLEEQKAKIKSGNKLMTVKLETVQLIV